MKQQQDENFCESRESFALREIGFDMLCLGVHEILIDGDKPRFRQNYDSEKLWCNHNVIKKRFEKQDWFCSAPLYQQAFRWFRETYNLNSFVKADTIYNEKFVWVIDFDVESIERFSTYEEAELSCLRKLIEIIKVARVNYTNGKQNTWKHFKNI
ncbi:MAG: hypothetical protein WC026_13145 [Hyphomicrobium sp.]|uniref:hypothetical protein n=1 Tax=Hyphomicrobium sp. TaxID=82 RepID=UPI00356AE4E3